MKVKKKKSDSNSEEIQEETKQNQIDKPKKRVKLTNLEKEELRRSILEDITNLYTPKQVERRALDKTGLCLRTVQKHINDIRIEIKEETPVIDVEKAREAQKNFIKSRIHYCLEHANKQNTSYERLLQDWIKQFNQLWPNELRIEKADSEKQINITFNKKSK